MRIYTQRYAMPIKTMQLSSVSAYLFLFSERFITDKASIVPVNVPEGAS